MPLPFTFSETWTLKKLDKDRLLAFELKCYRWILHIQWQQKVWNEVKKRIGANRNVFQIIRNTEKTPILWPHLPDEGRTNVKSHSGNKSISVPSWRAKHGKKDHVENGRMISRIGARRTCTYGDGR